MPEVVYPLIYWPVGIALGSWYPCLNPAKVRSAAEEQYAKLIEFTPDQWRFLRGVYAMNAEAPPGLPRGDYAVLAQGAGNSDSLLFFVDHGELGSPIHAPPAWKVSPSTATQGNWTSAVYNAFPFDHD